MMIKERGFMMEARGFRTGGVLHQFSANEKGWGSTMKDDEGGKSRMMKGRRRPLRSLLWRADD
jgi:hypothetical protein